MPIIIYENDMISREHRGKNKRKKRYTKNH